MSAWPSEEVPEYLVYGKNPRTMDFVFLVDSACSMGWQEEASIRTHGAHGYDIRNTDMHAIFYARGPAFRKGFLHPSFQNTDIYPNVRKTPSLQGGDISTNLLIFDIFFDDIQRRSPTGCHEITRRPQPSFPVVLFQFRELLSHEPG